MEGKLGAENGRDGKSNMSKKKIVSKVIVSKKSKSEAETMIQTIPGGRTAMKR